MGPEVDLLSSMLEAQSASHSAVTERGLPTAADFMRRPCKAVPFKIL